MKSLTSFLFLLLSALSFLIVLSLPAHALSPDTSLSYVSASFIGENVYDYAGWSVASAGDVNGDGINDIIIGADSNDEGGSGAGQTYLIFGKPSGWTMDTAISAASASFIGENAGDNSGRSVASAGDVNGDGLDDLLIGAMYYDDGSNSSAGKTYLLLGKTTGWASDTNLLTADASFIGEAGGDCSGVWVAPAGDVNNDGLDDFLIGAYLNDTNGTNAGKVYLIFGKETGWTSNVNLSAADASFVGQAAGDGAGKAVSSAGDVNGDGFSDIIIGATGNDEYAGNAGQTYLILGKESGWATNVSLSNSDASFHGEVSMDGSGNSVASAGDVNGNGFDDILIGADENDGGGNRAGKTYLIFGKETGWAMDVSLSNADASFLGESEGDHLGSSVASAGDVNRDGLDDILFGASWKSQYSGKAYLILGKATGWVQDTDLSTADASFLGEGTYDYAGFAVASAGDVNDDGADDILISAAYDYSGQTYLILSDYSAAIPTLNEWGMIIFFGLLIASAMRLMGQKTRRESI